MAKAKLTNDGEVTTYHTDGQTDVAYEIGSAIVDVMAKHKVQPHEALGVLGEGIISFLIAVAPPLGYDKLEIVKVFGKSLVDAEIGILSEKGS